MLTHSMAPGSHLQLLVRERLAECVDQGGAGLLPQGRQRAQQQRQLRRGNALQLRLRLLVGRLDEGMQSLSDGCCRPSCIVPDIPLGNLPQVDKQEHD